METLFLTFILGSLIYGVASKDAALEMVSKHGQLSVDGLYIVDEQGEQIQLKGMSLFINIFMEDYFTDAVVEAIHSQCHSNVVRAPMAIAYDDGYLTDPETNLAMIETIIEAAIANDIYVVVDWHDWEGEAHIPRAQEFFDTISKKYGKYPNIIYETYNEPVNVSWSSVIKPYHEAVIGTIRANDPDNIIVVGTHWYDMQYEETIVDPITDQTNIMYTLHFYAQDSKDWGRGNAQGALDAGLPLFVTEYGLASSSGNATVNPEEASVWYKWLDERKMSYVNWVIGADGTTSMSNEAGSTVDQVCQEEYLSDSGKLVVAQNKA